MTKEADIKFDWKRHPMMSNGYVCKVTVNGVDYSVTRDVFLRSKYEVCAPGEDPYEFNTIAEVRAFLRIDSKIVQFGKALRSLR